MPDTRLIEGNDGTKDLVGLTNEQLHLIHDGLDFLDPEDDAVADKVRRLVDLIWEHLTTKGY